MLVSVALGLMHLDWKYNQGYAVFYSNVFTIIMSITLVILPIYIWFYYNKNIEKLDEKNFRKRFGTLYDGLRLNHDEDHHANTRKLSILFPFTFVTRRILFVTAVLTLNKYSYLQVMAMFYVTTAMVIYLKWF